MTDVHEHTNLALLNRRENRWTKAFAILIGIVIILAGVVAGLVIAVIDLTDKQTTSNDLLNARTPIIGRIDASEQENLCGLAISLRFQAGIVLTLATPIENRAANVDLLVSSAQTIATAVSAGTDPCAITLPDLDALLAATEINGG